MNSKANAEDDVLFFDKTGTLNEASISSRSNFEDNYSFEHDLLLMVKRILEKSRVDDYNAYWDIMNLLGEYLEIQDYTTNLYSSWILKAIAQQTINHSNIIHEGDYTLFIQWLYEEILVTIHNPDTTREEFFNLMSKTFYHVLSEILNGKGLSIPLEIFYPQNEEEMEMPSKISLAESVNSKKLPLTTRVSEDIKLDDNISENISQYTLKLSYYENFLHAIIDATYQIFGSELNYTLIQSASNNEENVINYKIPYHFRYPRFIKKPEPVTRASAVLNSKSRKSRKSSIRKISAKESTRVPINCADNFTQSEFILPLSEALESTDVIICSKKNRENKRDSHESK